MASENDVGDDNYGDVIIFPVFIVLVATSPIQSVCTVARDHPATVVTGAVLFLDVRVRVCAA